MARENDELTGVLKLGLLCCLPNLSAWYTKSSPAMSPPSRPFRNPQHGPSSPSHLRRHCCLGCVIRATGSSHKIQPAHDFKSAKEVLY